MLTARNSHRKSGNSFKSVVQPGLEPAASGSQDNSTDHCSNVPDGADFLNLQTSTEEKERQCFFKLFVVNVN